MNMNGASDPLTTCGFIVVDRWMGGWGIFRSGVLPIPIILLWGIAVGPKPSAKREVIIGSFSAKADKLFKQYFQFKKNSFLDIHY